MKAHLSCGGRIFCSPQLSRDVRASPLPPIQLWLHPKPDEIGQGEPSPHLTLCRTLLSRRKPILSACCSCSLPPCWSRKMDWSRWLQPAQCLLGPPTHPHAIAPCSHSVLTAHALLFPPRRRTSEPPSAASRMWDSPPRSPGSWVFLGGFMTEKSESVFSFFFSFLSGSKL